MALLIEPNTKLIEIPGIDLTLESLYIRIEFACRADGRKVEVAFLAFKDKDKYLQNSPCFTSVPMSNIIIELEQGEKQDLLTIHQHCKTHFENLGYNVTLTDLD